MSKFLKVDINLQTYFTDFAMSSKRINKDIVDISNDISNDIKKEVRGSKGKPKNTTKPPGPKNPDKKEEIKERKEDDKKAKEKKKFGSK